MKRVVFEEEFLICLAEKNVYAVEGLQLCFIKQRKTSTRDFKFSKIASRYLATYASNTTSLQGGCAFVHRSYELFDKQKQKTSTS